MVIDHLCNFFVTIERARITKDIVGGTKREVWDAVAQNVPVAIQPLNSGIKQQFGSRQMINTHRLYFSTEPPIRRGDRIKAFDPDRMFVVTGVLDQGGRRRVFSVDVREQME